MVFNKITYSDYDPQREAFYKQSQALYEKKPINWAKINIKGGDPVFPRPFQYWNSPYKQNYIYPNIVVNPYAPDDTEATNVNFKYFLDKTIEKNNSYAYGGDYIKNRRPIIFS